MKKRLQQRKKNGNSTRKKYKGGRKTTYTRTGDHGSKATYSEKTDDGEETPVRFSELPVNIQGKFTEEQTGNKTFYDEEDDGLQSVVKEGNVDDQHATTEQQPEQVDDQLTNTEAAVAPAAEEEEGEGEGAVGEGAVGEGEGEGEVNKNHMEQKKLDDPAHINTDEIRPANEKSVKVTDLAVIFDQQGHLTVVDSDSAEAKAVSTSKQYKDVANQSFNDIINQSKTDGKTGGRSRRSGRKRSSNIRHISNRKRSRKHRKRSRKH